MTEAFSWKGSYITFFYFATFFFSSALNALSNGIYCHPFSFSETFVTVVNVFSNLSNDFYCEKPEGWNDVRLSAMAAVFHFIHLAISLTALPNAVIVSFSSESAMKYDIQLWGIETISFSKLGNVPSCFKKLEIVTSIYGKGLFASH